MNRTDRLLAIILELQAKKMQRAEDLAATFETSKRTIYRDVQALMEAGVPVVSQAGRGFSLIDGYFLPPLSFAHDEATMLLLGAALMADSFDSEFRAAAGRAASKIDAVLSDTLRDRVADLRSRIRFIAPEPADPDERQRLQAVRRAIVQSSTIHFVYHTRISSTDGESHTEARDADPLALVHVDGVWHLNAWCHLRNATRNFRLSRMESVVILPRTFQPAALPLADEARRMVDSLTLTGRVLLDPEAARWIAEDTLFYIQARDLTAEGFWVTLQMRTEKEVVGWIIQWAHALRRVEPESLRALVIAALRSGLDNLKSGKIE